MSLIRADREKQFTPLVLQCVLQERKIPLFPSTCLSFIGWGPINQTDKRQISKRKMCRFISMLLFSCLVMSDSFVTPWTVACQAPLSKGFPSKHTGVGCHFPLQGIFLTQGLNPCLLHWHMNSLPLSHQGRPYQHVYHAFTQNSDE